MLEFFLQPSAVTHRQSLGRLINQSTVLLMTCIGSLILLLALMILFHQNANATRGYQLRNLERERSRLLLDEELLQMQIANAQAIGQLEVDHTVQAMIPVKNALYSEKESSVAVDIKQ